MDSIERGIVDDIFLNPWDPAPRLAYADLIEEHGLEERAAMVREFAFRPFARQESPTAGFIEADMEIEPHGMHVSLYRGLIWSVHCESGSWRCVGASIMSMHPVGELILTDANPVVVIRGGIRRLLNTATGSGCMYPSSYHGVSVAPEVHQGEMEMKKQIYDAALQYAAKYSSSRNVLAWNEETSILASIVDSHDRSRGWKGNGRNLFDMLAAAGRGSTAKVVEMAMAKRTAEDFMALQDFILWARWRVLVSSGWEE